MAMMMILMVKMVMMMIPMKSSVMAVTMASISPSGREFPGIDYYLYLMLLSETIGLRFMSRLLFTNISSLILIHMMSRE